MKVMILKTPLPFMSYLKKKTEQTYQVSCAKGPLVPEIHSEHALLYFNTDAEAEQLPDTYAGLGPNKIKVIPLLTSSEQLMVILKIYPVE